MNNIFKTFFALFLMAAIFVVNSATVKADYFVHHKPKAVGQLWINKQVKHPTTGSFVDNLSITDPHFLPKQEVVFRIEVKNVGHEDIHDIEVKDILPEYVDFISGLSGYDGSRTLSLRIDKLTPNESKTYEIKTNVKDESVLPSNMVTCLTNMAEGRFKHIVNQDTASFCIEKKVLGVVKELPKTGVGGLEVALGTTVLSSLLAIGLAKRFKI